MNVSYYRLSRGISTLDLKSFVREDRGLSTGVAGCFVWNVVSGVTCNQTVRGNEL